MIKHKLERQHLKEHFPLSGASDHDASGGYGSSSDV